MMLSTTVSTPVHGSHLRRELYELRREARRLRADLKRARESRDRWRREAQAWRWGAHNNHERTADRV